MADANNDRIKGVTEFLWGRAQDNYFYIFEQNIKENSTFQCYFPNTYEYVASGDLKLLLTAGEEIWGESVSADVEAIMAQQAFQLTAKIGLKNIALNLTDRYTELLQNMEIEIGGESYRIDFIPLTASNEVRTGINQFYNNFVPARDKLLELNKQIEQQIAEQREIGDCTIKGVSLDDIDKVIDDFKIAMNGFKQWLEDIKRAGNKIKFLDNVRLDKMTADDLIKVFAKKMGRVQEYRDLLENVKNAKTHLKKVIATERLIREAIETGINPLGLSLQTKEYQRFRRYILLFAQLSDADSPEQVKAVLKEVTLPSVSFGMKREPQESHLMISAYLEYAAGVESATNQSDKSFSGVIGPLGIEYSYGLRSGNSLSVMFAPFDFGHPINLELQGKDESVEINDIITPGIYFTYGLRKKPLAIGIGYSRGRGIRTESDSEDRILLFFAFDMPLFSIY